MELPFQFRRHLSIPEERLVFLEPVRPIDLSQVGSGVLFVMARWAGASILAFRALNAALAEASHCPDLVVDVADADSENTERFIFGLGDVPSGEGETYWVRGGEVRHRLAGYGEAAVPLLKEYTVELWRSGG